MGRLLLWLTLATTGDDCYHDNGIQDDTESKIGAVQSGVVRREKTCFILFFFTILTTLTYCTLHFYMKQNLIVLKGCESSLPSQAGQSKALG